MNPFSIVSFKVDQLSEIDRSSVASTINKVTAFWSSSSSATTSSQRVTESVHFETADLAGNGLYIGLSDGSLAHFQIDPLLGFDGLGSHSQHHRNMISTILQSRVEVSTQKASQFDISIIPSENSLLALVDASLHFLNLKALKPSFNAIKGVFCFATDGKLQSPLQIAVGGKRSISVLLLDSQFKLDAVKHLGLSENAVSLCKFGNMLCFADSKSYHLASLKSEAIVPLFPYDASYMNPNIYCIEKKEFLLVTGSAQGFGIGVFVSAKGEPIRGTLQWPTIPISVVSYDSFVIALLKNSTVQIHDITTQSLVQSITLPCATVPKFLKCTSFPLSLRGEGSGEVNIIIGTNTEIFGLRMMPWDSQLLELFESNQISQALNLLAKLEDDDAAEIQLSKRGYFYNRAGLMFLEAEQFQKAFSFFKKGRLPPTIILPAFLGEFDQPFKDDGNLLPYSPSPKSLLNTIQSRTTMEIVIDYLEWLKEARLFVELKSEIDDALLILYTKTNHARLKSLLLRDCNCTLDRCEATLKEYKRYCILSLLCKRLEMHEKTLELWIKMASGELVDPDFEGIPLVVEYLKTISSKDLIWRYGRWLISRDPVRGVQVFIDRKDSLFSVDEITEFLESCGSKGKIEYLEHLWRQKKESPSLEIGTKLAFLYMDNLFHLSGDSLLREQDDLFRAKMKDSNTFVDFLRQRGDSFAIARLKFFDFVSASDLGSESLQSLWEHLSKEEERRKEIEETGNCFSLEKCSVLIAEHPLHLKMKMHKEVLELLVSHLNDSLWAERYAIHAGTVSAVNEPPHKMLRFLATLYLKEGYQTELVSLLSKYSDAMDLVDLIANLPSTWKLSDLRPILLRHEIKSRKQQNEAKLNVALFKSRTLKTRKILLDLRNKTPILVHAGTKCSICGKYFANTQIRLRSSDIGHVKC